MKQTATIRADVHFTALRLDELQLKDRNVVVLDVLRSGTSIAAALHRGAKQIIPVNNIESAMKIAGGLSSDVTLKAGERNARMIEGFHFGNSPREFTSEMVKGKSIIFLTTNGTSAVVKGKHARNLVMGGFVNLSRIVDFLAELRSDFVLLCAGKENSFSMEDAVCAGRILNRFSEDFTGKLELNDSAVAAMTLDKSHGKAILKMLKNTEHGRYLASIGLGEDLEICAAIDSVPVLPRLAGTVLKLHASG
ncbi:MAG TPA: 2-phosphosulfolactate phosphatase [Bacteroidota bacterium]|nr:2-phosphosulfolactate phosphatase [Bacteroidota bacterium]